MLSRTEYLLVKLAEECAEVAQRATKALTFGVEEIQKNQTLTNAQRVMGELADMAAVVGMLQDDGVLSVDLVGFRAMVEAKREKLRRYMQYSREKGCLEQDGGKAESGSKNKT